MRIVRKSDAAYVELNPAESRDALLLLWEHANGTPEAETREWVKDWIEFHEGGAKHDEGSEYWRPAERAIAE